MPRWCSGPDQEECIHCWDSDALANHRAIIIFWICYASLILFQPELGNWTVLFSAVRFTSNKALANSLPGKVTQLPSVRIPSEQRCSSPPTGLASPSGQLHPNFLFATTPVVVSRYSIGIYSAFVTPLGWQTVSRSWLGIGIDDKGRPQHKS